MDFNYITTSLEEETLYNTKAPYILLYFYNPECEDCTKIKKELSKNKELKEAEQKRIVELKKWDKKDKKTYYKQDLKNY